MTIWPLDADHFGQMQTAFDNQSEPYAYPYVVKRAGDFPPLDYCMDQRSAEDKAMEFAHESPGVWFVVIDRATGRVLMSNRIPKG